MTQLVMMTKKQYEVWRDEILGIFEDSLRILKTMPESQELKNKISCLLELVEKRES